MCVSVHVRHGGWESRGSPRPFMWVTLSLSVTLSYTLSEHTPTHTHSFSHTHTAACWAVVNQPGPVNRGPATVCCCGDCWTWPEVTVQKRLDIQKGHSSPLRRWWLLWSMSKERMKALRVNEPKLSFDSDHLETVFTGEWYWERENGAEPLFTQWICHTAAFTCLCKAEVSGGDLCTLYFPCRGSAAGEQQ